jgi:hypothetical protein
MVWRNSFINAKIWVGINLHLVNRCLLIKFYQLKKMLTAEGLSLPLIDLHIPPSAEYQLSKPKIGTGETLTCESNLAEELHSAGGFPQSIR